MILRSFLETILPASGWLCGSAEMRNFLASAALRLGVGLALLTSTVAGQQLIRGPLSAPMLNTDAQSAVPRRAAKLTHLRAPKLTHPGRSAAAAKALMGKALSSPPAAGGGVTLGVHTRANSRARRRVIFRCCAR